MHRVVFDTVVFVRCLINPYGIWGRLVFEHGATYRLVLSEPVMTEILEVIRRPELTRKFERYNDVSLLRILDIFAGTEIVDLGEIPRVCRDPDDDKFLATAAAAAASYLVSEDRDLLDLGVYNGIQIVDGATFLGILGTAER